MAERVAAPSLATEVGHLHGEIAACRAYAQEMEVRSFRQEEEIRTLRAALEPFAEMGRRPMGEVKSVLVPLAFCQRAAQVVAPSIEHEIGSTSGAAWHLDKAPDGDRLVAGEPPPSVGEADER
jgi:hypothetical protein